MPSAVFLVSCAGCIFPSHVNDFTDIGISTTNLDNERDCLCDFARDTVLITVAVDIDTVAIVLRGQQEELTTSPAFESSQRIFLRSNKPGDSPTQIASQFYIPTAVYDSSYPSCTAHLSVQLSVIPRLSSLPSSDPRIDRCTKICTIPKTTVVDFLDRPTRPSVWKRRSVIAKDSIYSQCCLRARWDLTITTACHLAVSITLQTLVLVHALTL